VSAAAIDIPHGNGIRRIVNPRPPIVGKRRRHFVNAPSLRAGIKPDNVTSMHFSGPHFSVLIRQRIVEIGIL